MRLPRAGIARRCGALAEVLSERVALRDAFHPLKTGEDDRQLVGDIADVGRDYALFCRNLGRMSLRLHIGGLQTREGWQILNAKPGPGVDHVGNCTDLSRFADATVDEIYTAHVLEHLGYRRELAVAISEMHRVLVAGGTLRISVPDLEVLCRLYLDGTLSADARFHVMRMMFGGQIDEHDFHKVGLNWDLMHWLLSRAGFHDVRHVREFNLFPGDSSGMQFAGRHISLNIEARKV